MPDRYIAVIFDVGELEVYADSIEQAAQHFALAWGNEAVLEVRRADYRELSR